MRHQKETEIRSSSCFSRIPSHGTRDQTSPYTWTNIQTPKENRGGDDTKKPPDGVSHPMHLCHATRLKLDPFGHDKTLRCKNWNRGDNCLKRQLCSSYMVKRLSKKVCFRLLTLAPHFKKWKTPKYVRKQKLKVQIWREDLPTKQVAKSLANIEPMDFEKTSQ